MPKIEGTEMLEIFECPHCGTRYRRAFEPGSKHKLVCDECGKEFEIEVPGLH